MTSLRLRPIVSRMDAGWYTDPLGRFEKRYHNGRAWTLAVSHHGRGLRDTTDDERSAFKALTVSDAALDTGRRFRARRLKRLAHAGKSPAG